MFQLYFNLNRIHDNSIGKALRTANEVNEGRVTANSHVFSSSFDPGLNGYV